MNIKEKNILIKDILECTRDAAAMDSDDSDKEEIIMALIDLCGKATSLPTKRRRNVWVKPWRISSNDRSSFAFLTKELLLKDSVSYNNYLRMNVKQFDYLLSLVKADIELTNTRMRDAIPADEQLALTLRFFATGESFQSLNYQTRLSTTSISRIVPRVCESIWRRLKGLHLKFPTSSLQWEAIAKDFCIRWQFPNCLGALDGKHINFRSSRKDGAFYHNYKGTNSIILMALVDANFKFIFVEAGCNGRTNDAGMFLQSKLKTVLEKEIDLPPKSLVGNGRNLPYVVIADDAFPMQTHLMKPYPYHTNCGKKKVFNARLSRARHVVEHAFGILSNRFRVFLTTMHLKAETVELITLACCALHNYLIDNDNNYINSQQITPDTNNEASSNDPYNPRKGEAEGIRQQFMNYFNEEGRLDWLKCE